MNCISYSSSRKLREPLKNRYQFNINHWLQAHGRTIQNPKRTPRTRNLHRASKVTLAPLSYVDNVLRDRIEVCICRASALMLRALPQYNLGHDAVYACALVCGEFPVSLLNGFKAVDGSLARHLSIVTSLCCPAIYMLCHAPREADRWKAASAA
jgi:hypothetical protein